MWSSTRPTRRPDREPRFPTRLRPLRRPAPPRPRTQRKESEVALSSRNRRALAVLAGVAVAGAAAVMFVFFMGGGGEEPQEAAAPVTQTPTTPKATPKKQAKQNKPAKKRAPTFAFFGGRDPFVPLVVAETGGAGANTSGAINAVDSPSGGSQVADATVVGGHNVSLININGDNVQ